MRAPAWTFALPVLLLSTFSACDPPEDPGEAAAPETPAERTEEAAPRSLADSLSRWHVLGINAHHLCAGLWVVGRDLRRSPEDVVARDLAPFPAFRWSDDLDFQVDDDGARTATVSAPRIGARTARYVGDQGCVILPAGADDVSFEAVEVRSALPDPETQDWPTGDRGARADFPEVDGQALEATLEWAFDDEVLPEAQNTRGLVVVYRDRIVAERYAPGWGPYTPQISWSMGKSLASALTGVLVEQGELAPDEPAPVPEWQGPRDPRREIRIADLLQMSSGLDFDNFGLGPEGSYLTANEHMRIYFDAVDAFAHAVNQPLRFEPGTVWRYRNSDPLTLMYLARRAVEARGEEFLTFPQRNLFDRIGIRSFVLETDAWGGFLITGYDYGGTRDWARFGLLHLKDGVWEGERILPEGWVERVTTPAPGDPSRGYGGLFWLNRGGAMEGVPADAFWAAGFMGQRTLVIPSRDLVVVRQGPTSGGFGPYFEELVVRILEATGAEATEDAGSSG